MKVGNVNIRIPTTQHGIRALLRVFRTYIATCSVPCSATCIYTSPICPNFMEIFYDMFMDPCIMYHVCFLLGGTVAICLRLCIQAYMWYS